MLRPSDQQLMSREENLCNFSILFALKIKQMQFDFDVHPLDIGGRGYEYIKLLQLSLGESHISAVIELCDYCFSKKHP